MKTRIVNFYGGPGTGKSTSAALAYAKLKQAGVNCELVREYVKDWAWEKRQISNYDQLYFLGKQIRRESLLYGKTDVIVTDSPIMMGIYYAHRYNPPHIYEGVLKTTQCFYKQAEVDGFEHIHVFLNRTKEYKAEGRFQTEAEAKQIDVDVSNLLDALMVKYIRCGTEEQEITDLLHNLKML